MHIILGIIVCLVCFCVGFFGVTENCDEVVPFSAIGIATGICISLGMF